MLNSEIQDPKEIMAIIKLKKLELLLIQEKNISCYHKRYIYKVNECDFKVLNQK